MQLNLSGFRASVYYKDGGLVLIWFNRVPFLEVAAMS